MPDCLSTTIFAPGCLLAPALLPFRRVEQHRIDHLKINYYAECQEIENDRGQTKRFATAQACNSQHQASDKEGHAHEEKSASRNQVPDRIFSSDRMRIENAIQQNPAEEQVDQ